VGAAFIGAVEAIDPQVADAVVQDFAAAARTIGGQQVMATVSAGLALAGEETEDIGEPLTRADRALYRAKHLGRNRTESATTLSPVTANRFRAA